MIFLGKVSGLMTSTVGKWSWSQQHYVGRGGGLLGYFPVKVWEFTHLVLRKDEQSKEIWTVSESFFCSHMESKISEFSVDFFHLSQ